MIIYIKTYYYIISNLTLSRPLPEKGFYAYIKEIKNADLVVGMGGGYFTAKNKYLDYFGLLLSTLPVLISNHFNKILFFLPISFGPFAGNLQKSLIYNSIKKARILARDMITLEELKKMDKDNSLNVSYAPDLALFFPEMHINPDAKLKSDYIVLTAREWFSDRIKQTNYEDSLRFFIDKIWKDFKLKTIFIPMARNIIEDDDNRLANRIMTKVKDKKSFKIFDPNSLQELQSVLGRAKLAVCTRMHSAILSTTVHTPFIAIGYGHKTLGFVKSFGIEKWYIDINDINLNLLFNKYLKLVEYNNYKKFNQTIKSKQKEIQKYKNIIINELRI